jgi:hypothetical protein
MRFAVQLLLRRPFLLGPLLLAAWRFRARGWWRRPPFLPVPPRAYLDWRQETAFGAAGGLPSPAQLGRYLRWTRRARADSR